MSALHGPVERTHCHHLGGVNALMLAVQALVDAGDEVVAVTPVWPNLTAQPAIMGARVPLCALRPVRRRLDAGLPSLLAAVTPATKVLILNAPNNPTGWTLTRASSRPCWTTAGARAPGSWPTRCMSACISRTTRTMAARRVSGHRRPDDRLVVVHSFS
jgi:hypothetical protein